MKIMMIIKIQYSKKYIKFKPICPAKIHSIKDFKNSSKKSPISIKLNLNWKPNKNTLKK